MDDFDFKTTWKAEIVTELKTESILLGKFPLKTNEIHYLYDCNENLNLIMYVQDTKDESRHSFSAAIFAQNSATHSHDKKEFIVWDGELLLVTHKDVSFDLRNSLFQGKISFFMDMKSIQMDSGEFQLFVVLNSCSFSSVDNPAADIQVTRNMHSGPKDNLKYLFQNMYELKDDCVQYESPYPIKKKSIQDLYQYTQQYCLTRYKYENESLQAMYQHPSLLPSIRNYQARAVHWMYAREKQEQTNADEKGIHPLWQEIHCRDGTFIYLQIYSGKISKEKPPPDPLPSGGVLADEMGLGKTVEILALHLNNQRPKRFQITMEEENANSEDHLQGITSKQIHDKVLKRTATQQQLLEDCNCTPQSKLQKFDNKSTNNLEIDNGTVTADNNILTDAPKDCNEKLPDVCYVECTTDRFEHLAETQTALRSQDAVDEDVQLTLQYLLDECEKSTSIHESVLENALNAREEEQNKQAVPSKLQMKTNEKKATHSCFICSDEIDEDHFVCCCKCSYVMHRNCSGYDMKNVARYECPNCAMKNIIDTHCTLIVCPDTLQKQWYDEVKRHIKAGEMKVMIYLGVKHHKFLQPELLAEYDLIVTSFNTLRQDFNYVKTGSVRNLRHKKKYASLPCPLLAINFWRVCIDEAQMVETKNTKLAEMTLRIRAVNRWCVTGTPFTREVEDVYGLLLFLGVRPYYYQLWWQRALYDHYTNGNFVPLFDVVSRMMWRSCKADVLDEICIPEQTEHISWLNFSGVERHFYQQQFQKLHHPETRLKEKFPDPESQSLKLSDISPMKGGLFFLYDFLAVRQACIHPTVVRNGYLSMEKKCVTMDQVLERLIDNAKLECAEAHRKLLCALNGLAGVELLQYNAESAGNYYREAIDSWEERNEFKTDSLQKLHTLHNLCEIFPMLPEERKNLKVDLKKLSSEKHQLRTEYMLAVDDNVRFNKDALFKTKQELNELHSKIDLVNVWWLNVISRATMRNISDQLAMKIMHDMSASRGKSLSSLKDRFNSLVGLQYLLQEKLEMIQKVRSDVSESLSKVLKPPTKEDVYRSSECCLRPEPGSDAPRCLYCMVEDEIKEYEKYLFSQQGANSEMSGFRSDTDVDIVLKTLHNFAKQHGMGSNVIQASKHHLKYVEALKKEFKNIRSLYMACHGRVQAIDELDMCTMRLRFPFAGEEHYEGKKYVVKPTEVKVTCLTLLSDKMVATSELKAKQGQWLYLQNLALVQTEHDGYNPDLCPICVIPFGVEWAVFTCGHCVCCKCVVQLQSQSVAYARGASRTVIRCPICRVVMRTQEVSYVVTKQKKIEGFDCKIPVKGHHSTKIEAIVRRVLWIQEMYRGAKVLVFSTWTTVLHLIANALKENDVLHKHFDGSCKHAQTSLTTFKESSDHNVLLLCLTSGAKGLNIIEATHVILAEPALNPGDELQAVGRVHRIGQTKKTFVHRFLVKGTIEEKMFNLLKDKSKQENTGSSTSMELTIGDLSTLFKRDDVEE